MDIKPQACDVKQLCFTYTLGSGQKVAVGVRVHLRVALIHGETDM